MSQSVEQVTQYRGGLIVPDFEVDMSDPAYRNIGTFFGNMFDANGTGWPNYTDRHAPVAYTNEIVVPPSPEKPLVVIRESYTPTAEWRRANQVSGNKRMNSFDNSGGYGRIDERVVTVATTEMSVLLPPDEGTLTWRSLLSYRYNHKGGAPLIDSSQFDEPVIFFEGQNKAYRKADGVWGTERNVILNKAVKRALDQFVALVSE